MEVEKVADDLVKTKKIAVIPFQHSKKINMLILWVRII